MPDDGNSHGDTETDDLNSEALDWLPTAKFFCAHTEAFADTDPKILAMVLAERMRQPAGQQDDKQADQ